VRAPNFSQDYLYTNPDYYLRRTAPSADRANNFARYVQDSLSFLNDRIILSAGSRLLDSRATRRTMWRHLLTDRSLGRQNTHKYGIVVKPVKGVFLLLFRAAPTSSR